MLFTCDFCQLSEPFVLSKNFIKVSQVPFTDNEVLLKAWPVDYCEGLLVLHKQLYANPQEQHFLMSPQSQLTPMACILHSL